MGFVEFPLGPNGGWTQLASVSLTGSSVTISSIPPTYNTLKLVLRDVSLSADGGVQLRYNGVTTSNYQTAYVYSTSGTSGAMQTYRYVDAAQWYVNDTSWEGDTGFSTHSIIEFPDYRASDSYVLGRFQFMARTASGLEQTVFGMYGQNSAAVINSLTIFTNVNFDEGTAILYGI